MKIVNSQEENLQIFWTSWAISTNFSEKIWLMIMLKVTENSASPFLWKREFWKKQQAWGRGGEGVKLTSLAFLEWSLEL